MKSIIVVLISLLTFQMGVAQTEVGNVTLPNKVSFGGENLILNGGGVRKKAIVLKLYSGGLYLLTKSSDAKGIINSDKTMALKLHITSSFVSSEAMSEAILEGFDASMDGNTSSLKSEINTFISFFKEEIVEDNIFDITYQNGKGVVVYKDGKEKGTVKGMAFKKALFGIWLGSDPVDSKLKKGMLGK